MSLSETYAKKRLFLLALRSVERCGGPIHIVKNADEALAILGARYAA